ncbi:MAG TPA: carboxylesterase family protein [Myxococcota bacterium]|nr:carboxylesterase family protein [Myxococcota bacterium]
MRKTAAACLLCLAFASFACSRSRPGTPPRHADPASQRATTAGAVIGFSESPKTHTWLGVPFAKPPVGDLRWWPPQPPEAWTGVREALAPGSACVQLAGTLGDEPDAKKGTVTGHEDCLYLNVYAPRASADEAAGRRLPVMFWIHGGGNSVGHAAPYDGSSLAGTYNVVVVTANYRLGPFGWFLHPALAASAESDEERSGNWGTLDQIRALEWVRDNAAEFGGDPNNVTIFGESAGGNDVMSLLLSPRAAGLFHRAISQSGGLSTTTLAEAQNLVDDAPAGDERSSAEATLRILFPGVARDDARKQLAELRPSELAARLRAATPAEVFAGYSGSDGFGGMVRLPMVLRDGAVLPGDDPLQLFEEGRWNRVPVMLGTNHDELKLFLFGDPKLVRYWFGFLPRLRDPKRYDVIAQYGTMSWKLRAVDAPAEAMLATPGPEVFAYRFDWDEEPSFLGSDYSRLLGAAHGLEIPFVFRSFDDSPFRRVFTERNRAGREELADAMSSYWAQFAYSGSPGRGRSGQLPEWKHWDTADGADKFIVFDTHAGGGVRMDNHPVTKQLLLGELARDSRADPALRCEIFQQLVDRKTVVADDREAAGCTQKALGSVARSY